MRAKAKDREKQCAYCERTFNKEEHLKRHERSHTGEKPFKCHKCTRRYGRSDVLARHLLTHPPDDMVDVQHTNVSTTNGVRHPPPHDGPNMALQSEHEHPSLSSYVQQPFTLFSDVLPPASNQHPAHTQPSLLPRPNTSNPPAVVPCSTATQHMSASSQEEMCVPTNGADTVTWPTTLNEGMEEISGQDWDVLIPALEPDAEHVPGLTTSGLLDENASRITYRSPSTQTNGSQLSFWQILRNQGTLCSPEMDNMPPDEFSIQQPENQFSRLPSFSSVEKQPPWFQTGDFDVFQNNPLLLDGELGSYTFLRHSSLDYVEFPETPQTSVQTPPAAYEEQNHKPNILFSVDQVQKMRKLWRGHRSNPCKRIGPSLWHTLVHHPADNIFSRPAATESKQSEQIAEGQGTSRWSLDENCRKNMIEFCNELDEKIYHEDLADLTPHSTPHNSDTGHGSSSLRLAANGFPSREVLDAALDLFFQCSHLPFIHKATFEAATTPPSFLLLICLVGLSSLYPERFKPFILRYQKVADRLCSLFEVPLLTDDQKLMRYCRSELTAKALGQCQPWELLLAIASTLLVVYLSLGYIEELDECQAHMLAVQMLHIAEKHGLFVVPEGRELASQLQAGPTDREGTWKAWGRAESVKRMTSCLLWMDLAYTRLMNSAGVVDVDKIELHLQCESDLFDATTSNRFLQVAQRGAQLLGPRIRVQNFASDPPTALNHLSMETFLVLLYLQVAATRYKLPIGNYAPLEARRYNLVEVFSRNARVRDVVASLLLLPSKYESLFQQRHRVTAFAWNNVCIGLTADIDLLEIASGREGFEPARTAIVAVTKWSNTPGARRAALHAAQFYDILSSSRLSESSIARPDLLLFHSALILSMYVFVSKHEEDYDDCAVFELLQSVNWTIVGPEGLRSPVATNPPIPNTNDQRSVDASYAARDFIRHGGPVSFSGELLLGGGATARKILLNYVRLLDAAGKWSGSRYSQLLRTMSDFVIEGNG